MGYKSCFHLSARPMTEDLYKKIDAELQLYTCYFENDGIENEVGHWCNADDTWYNCRADMIQLSKMFPEVLFELLVEGEDHNDDWRAFFIGGKYQVNEAYRVYEPFIPAEFQEGEDPDGIPEYEDIIQMERRNALRTALYHCSRVFLAKEESDFPWDSELMDAAKTVFEEFLRSKGFTVPSLENPTEEGQNNATVTGIAKADIC